MKGVLSKSQLSVRKKQQPNKQWRLKHLLKDVTSTQNAQVQAINDTLVLAFRNQRLAAIEAAEATKRQQIQDSQMLARRKDCCITRLR